MRLNRAAVRASRAGAVDVGAEPGAGAFALTAGSRYRSRMDGGDPRNVLDLFHPATRAWFESAFAAPTPAQERAWPAIRAGRHALIAAPTGSCKTLAAFLAAIDSLVRDGIQAGLPDQTRVVYV